MNDRLKTKVKSQKAKVYGLWLMALMFIISSCSTHKETSSIRMMSADKIISEVENNEFEFDNLEATIGIKLEGDNKLGLKGQLRMKNDSVIWVSISLKLGVEVARVMITNDSIKLVNRSARTYVTENIELINNILPVDVSLQFFQDLLVGNISGINSENRYKVSIDEGRYKLISAGSDFMVNSIWVTPKDFKISKYNIQDNNNKIEFRYDEFQNVGGKMMPSKISFELSSGYKVGLEINYSDIEVGDELSFPFNISKKYDKTYLW